MTELEAPACLSCGAPIPPASRFCPGCGREFSTIAAGEVLDGKYEILNKIGEGGMGEVFRARHVHLDEIRIIKVMKPAALGEAAQQRRFAEEARLATLVRHPNVAALYDFARLPGGTFYMVWEFIDGITVLQHLRTRGKMGVEDAIDISQQVLAGLSEIHRAGVVHRDISPDNIMILQKDGRLVAKIIDLGIAKRVAADLPAMTGTGMFLGKLKYCSPEQAGAIKPGESLDARSDLYSFGAVLYEMLSGRPLFEAPTPEGYLVKHLQEPPPRLDVSGLPAEAGAALAAIVARALQKDRRRRFASAAEFSAALGSIRPVTRTLPTVMAAGVTGEETQLLAPADHATAGVSRRRLRSLIALASAALALGLLAFGYARWRAIWNEGPAAPASRPPLPAAPPDRPARPAETSSAPPPAPRVIERKPPSTEPPPAARPEPAPESDHGPEPAEAAPAAEADPAQRYASLRREAASSSESGRELRVFANRYVAAHPDTPLSRRIREELPAGIKRAALRHERLGHPVKAMRAYELYESLDFAPKDTEVEEHLAALREALQKRGRFRKR